MQNPEETSKGGKSLCRCGPLCLIRSIADVHTGVCQSGRVQSRTRGWVVVPVVVGGTSIAVSFSHSRARQMVLKALEESKKNNSHSSLVCQGGLPICHCRTIDVCVFVTVRARWRMMVWSVFVCGIDLVLQWVSWCHALAPSLRVSNTGGKWPLLLLAWNIIILNSTFILHKHCQLESSLLNKCLILDPNKNQRTKKMHHFVTLNKHQRCEWFISYCTWDAWITVISTFSLLSSSRA